MAALSQHPQLLSVSESSRAVDGVEARGLDAQCPVTPLALSRPAPSYCFMCLCYRLIAFVGRWAIDTGCYALCLAP